MILSDSRRVSYRDRGKGWVGLKNRIYSTEWAYRGQILWSGVLNAITKKYRQGKNVKNAVLVAWSHHPKDIKADWSKFASWS